MLLLLLIQPPPPSYSLQLIICKLSSITGKTWWALTLGPRLSVLLLGGFTLFADEQERFTCNTLQPGCANVCFDAFAPVSVSRLWLLHLLLLSLPHLLFATYVSHEVSAPGGLRHERGRGAPPLSLDDSSSSLQKLQAGGRRFYCAYVLVVLSRVLVEAVFGAGQFYLFGLSFPKSFLCYEAPCSSGVECYVSRRTEKSLMLRFMLAVASLSVLLSLFDLTSSVKAMASWRRRREELIKGDQSSVFTATTVAEDGDKSSESNNKDPEGDRPPTPISTPAPRFVLNLGPPPSPRLDRELSPNPRPSAPVGGRANAVQQSDRRAWV